MNVVANAIYYNPTLALQALQQQGSLSSYLTAWMQVRPRYPPANPLPPPLMGTLPSPVGVSLDWC